MRRNKMLWCYFLFFNEKDAFCDFAHTVHLLINFQWLYIMLQYTSFQRSQSCPHLSVWVSSSPYSNLFIFNTIMPYLTLFFMDMPLKSARFIQWILSLRLCSSPPWKVYSQILSACLRNSIIKGCFPTHFWHGNADHLTYCLDLWTPWTTFYI